MSEDTQLDPHTEAAPRAHTPNALREQLSAPPEPPTPRPVVTVRRVELIRVLKTAQTRAIADKLIINGAIDYIEDDPEAPAHARIVKELRDCLATSENHGAALGHAIRELSQP